jgi:hypothetical protein
VKFTLDLLEDWDWRLIRKVAFSTLMISAFSLVLSFYNPRWYWVPGSRTACLPNCWSRVWLPRPPAGGMTISRWCSLYHDIRHESQCLFLQSSVAFPDSVVIW